VELKDTIERARELLACDDAIHARDLLLERWNAGDRTFDLIAELVLCNLVLDLLPEARRFLALAESLAESHTRVECYRGLLALAELRYQDAVACFERALAVDPNNAEAYKWRGLCYREMSEYGRALADMDRAAAHLRDDTALLIHRGTVHFEQGDHIRALDDFRRATELAPYHPHAHFHAGHALVKLQQLDAAQEHYDLAIETDFLCLDAWLGLATVFMLRQQFSEAVRCLAVVLGFEPDHVDARVNLVQAAIELGDFELAARQIALLPTTHQRDPDVLTFEAVVDFHRGRLDDARKRLDDVLLERPTHGLANYYRALIELELEGDRVFARELLLAASRHAACHPGPELVLAEMASTDGDPVAANQFLTAALERAPALARKLHAFPVLQTLVNGDELLRKAIAAVVPMLGVHVGNDVELR